MIQQQWLQLQLKLVLGDCIKIAIWWGGNGNFGTGGYKFGEVDFSGEGNE